MDTFLLPSDSILSLKQAELILNNKGYLYDKLYKTDYNKFKKTADYQKLKYAEKLFFDKYRSFLYLVRKHNELIFEKQLVDISGEFIMQNPNQVRKSIKGNRIYKSFPLEEINAYTEFNLADFLAERLKDLPQNS